MEIHMCIFQLLILMIQSLWKEIWEETSLKAPFGLGIGALPFTSPEDLMKNLPEAMSNMLEGAGMGMPYELSIFKINMKEYEDIQLKVGEKVTIVIKKTDDSSTGI